MITNLPIMQEKDKLKEWDVRFFIVQSAVLAAILLVGYFLYHEVFTWNKVVGVVICLIGLVFINYK